jgi:hypothetical protein
MGHGRHREGQRPAPSSRLWPCRMIALRPGKKGSKQVLTRPVKAIAPSGGCFSARSVKGRGWKPCLLASALRSYECQRPLNAWIVSLGWRQASRHAILSNSTKFGEMTLMNTCVPRQCHACGEAWIPDCFSHCPTCDARLGYRWVDILKHGLVILPTLFLLACVTGLFYSS